MIGDIINFDNSETGERVGKLRITDKHQTTFGELPLTDPSHETYDSKDQQRQVLSGYYAYLGRLIADEDPFLVFNFELQ